MSYDAKRDIKKKEIASSPILVVHMMDSPNVSGGGTTQTVGFQIKKQNGDPLAIPVLVEFAIFEDAYFSVPAHGAILSDASVGTIIAGSRELTGEALKVVTDSTGTFRCILTDILDETIYLTCFSTPGGPALDCRSIDSVTFS